MTKKAIFVANRGFAIFNSRLQLMNRLRDEFGYQVLIVCERDRYAIRLEELGYRIIPLDVYRGGGSLKKDLALFLTLARIYLREKPAFIHQFHVKPVIFGSLAARLFSPSTTIINTITGLGYAFGQGGAIHHAARLLYRVSLRFSAKVIFQNPDDREYFIRSGFIKPEKTVLIIGSGVDTEKFCPPPTQDLSPAPFKVLMAGRLLWQKGVREYVEAATLVKKRHPEVTFLLAGEFETDHPDAVPESYILSSNSIKFIGYAHDMAGLLKSIDLFVLPSYYREGVPRVLPEAASSGIPVICANAPGTREAVIPGKTGITVTPKNTQELAKAIGEILDNPSLHESMAKAAREFAVTHFDINQITERQLQVYRQTAITLE